MESDSKRATGGMGSGAFGPGPQTRVLVCGGKECAGQEGLAVQEELEARIIRRGLEGQVKVAAGPCPGLCAAGPVVVILPRGILYARVHVTDVPAIVEETLVKGRVVERLLYEEPAELKELPLYRELAFFSRQVRVALANCGVIDPDQIEEYVARDGYRALAKAITQMTPQEVLGEVKDSGLRGRGGAGFSTGQKWEFCRKATGNPKYVVCNADEGDPGAFMDRSILESDPHSVLEGMAIAAYAIGSVQGFIYCREEYPLAIERLQRAIAQARDYGLLGQNILGSEFSFDIEIKEGAGAFVCGEETALIASIEGRRGEPRPRPPYPVASGLWGKPTNINNVKSYAMTPRIVLRGAKWFSSIGTPKSPGTAIFALTGKVNNTGLVEVPMGTPLGDIIFDVGGGIPKNKPFKAVQTGGPLGGCLPVAALNTPVDFDSLVEAGAVMGSGGMIVVDEDTCMVDLAKYFLTFAAAESCGKCVPCRVGGQRLLDALTRICDGHGEEKDLQIIREVSAAMMEASLCGLGQRTPGPVMAALRFFEQEFKEHVHDKQCIAGQCRPLVRAKCLNGCPAGVDTPAYLALVAQGKYEEALEIHRERNPFAMVCGRACPAYCEKRCRRSEVDQPVAIRLVKRFMADHEYEKGWVPRPLVPAAEYEANHGKQVGIIGAGPAGLTAALRLAQYGYRVTVHEKMSTPGGMLSWAIPEYRLPRQTLRAEIGHIQRAGVEIRCGSELGRDFTLAQMLDSLGYAAVILAVGAHKSRRLGIPGEDKMGVMNGLDFLRRIVPDAAPAERPNVKGKRVGIVGGGDVAIDVARCAMRLGAAQVHVLYRRAGENMPAAHLPEEIDAAMQEGVQFHTLVNPVEVLGDKEVTGVRVQRQRLAEFDVGGRRRPVGVEQDFYTLQLDMLVPAVGQTPDLSWLTDKGLQVTQGSTLVTGEAFNTTRAGVFAIGDAVTGPATIIAAVAHGNLVAVAVDRWLHTGALTKPRYVTQRHDVMPEHDLQAFGQAPRSPSPKLAVPKRQDNFQEVELGLDEHTAREEAKRCLRCDLEWLEMMQMDEKAGAAGPATEEART
ncbi:MAG: FAD-dependent oxidoreductase [Phycisphaeraceae bacterium]|nr:FAD-dependent oxidoreductase [Phycisphaeraceae bacterium]